MKVCTDACLFGALLPAINTGNALDIGTGTGLLSLMFAQKNDCIIDAIEIDIDAFEQAKQNVDESIWKEKIKVHCVDIKSFEPSKKYDIIFSNPPFYANDLKSSDAKKNIAMHSSLLRYDDLLKTIARVINESGIFAVLLPFSSEETFVNIAKAFHLFPNKITRVKQTEKHHYFRSIIQFSGKEKSVEQIEITIKMNDDYSQEFTALLKDYYLFL